MESRKQRDKSQRTNLLEMTPSTKRSLFGAPVKVIRVQFIILRKLNKNLLFGNNNRWPL